MICQLLARRYQILRVLGAGAFGQTYVAQDTHIPGNPTCVVKHLKPTSNAPKLLETARQLFQREAETLVKLGKHEQIPQLLAYFEEDQEFYLVQEFIEGHTLTNELLPGQCWSESQVIQLLEEVLSILEFVHSEGVIHRDIKPDNIMRRSSDNKLVLIDFGAIKQVQTQPLSTAGQEQSVATSIRIGTPGYTPTEQDWGKPRPSSDLYALARVGIQALTGLYPHQLQEDDETGELLWQHLAQVSPGVAAILTQMARYHFKDRYQSATQALQALQQWQNSSPKTLIQETVVDTVTHCVHELLTATEKYTPTNKATQQVSTLLQTVAPTVQPLAVQTASQNTNSSFSTNQALRPIRVRTHSSFTSNKKLPLLMRLGVAALVTVGGGYAYVQWHSNLVATGTLTAKSDSTVNSNATDLSKTKSDSTANSNLTDLSTTKSDSTANSNPTDLSTTKSDSTANTVKTGTLISDSDLTANLVKTGTLISDSETTANLVRTASLTTNSEPTANLVRTVSLISDSEITDKLVRTASLITNSDSTANLVRTGKLTTNSDSTEPLADKGSRQLKNAIKKASEGEFKKAIALAEQISSKSSVYQQALNEIAKWQGQQRQKLVKQQADNQARTLLANATDVAKRGGETDMETAIRIAEEAIAQVPPDSAVSREAQNAIARWQQEASAKREQEAVPSSYTCSCQPNEPDAQNAVTDTESGSDLTGSSCAIDEASEARAIGVWACNKK